MEEKQCYVCGVAGFQELIVTCMDCKSTFVHLYCMKTVQFVIPNDWMCEDCPEIPKQGQRHIVSPESASKPVEVPTERVDNLRNISLTRCDVSVCIPEQSRCEKHTVDERMPSTVPESFKKQKSCTKDSMHTRMASSVSKPSPDLENFKELFIPTRTAYIKSRRGLDQGDNPYKVNLKGNKNTRDQRLNGLDTYKGILKATESTRDQRLTGENWKVDRYLPNHPASIATWKGCFDTSGLSAPVSPWVTVWGYPPAKVGKKAYEFSKTMPDFLPFETIPKRPVWENMFNDGDPDKNDIGLYFFPNDTRSEQHYSCLVSHLEKQDIVLKSCIFGIDLLIFSSSCLDDKSKEINQAYYLWGLFVDPVSTLRERDQIQVEEHRGEAEKDVDVEIDMVGGKEVGSEVRVKLEKWEGEELASPPGFPAAVPRVVPSVPPGFEQEWRVKYKTIHEILQSPDVK